MKILGADVEDTFAQFTISSSSANFLTIRFETTGDIEVDNVADACFVNALGNLGVSIECEC
jgi:hypothetical protein